MARIAILNESNVIINIVEANPSAFNNGYILQEDEVVAIGDLVTQGGVVRSGLRYKSVDKLEFMGLLMTAGGVTSFSQILADPSFADFKLMYDAAEAFEPDHPLLDQALTQLDASAYMPNGKQAVLDAWPRKIKTAADFL